jgi:hypothetical protein
VQVVALLDQYFADALRRLECDLLARGAFDDIDDLDEALEAAKERDAAARLDALAQFEGMIRELTS